MSKSIKQLSPFDDLDALELDAADLLELTSSSSRGSELKVRKPGKQEFFRVSTAPEHRPRLFSIFAEEKPSDKVYFVAKEAISAMGDLCKQRLLHVCVTIDGTVFISPVGTGNDGWSASSRELHEQAQTCWLRMASNPVREQYGAVISPSSKTPEFPSESMGELLKRAFPGDLYIANGDHPTARRMAGHHI